MGLLILYPAMILQLANVLVKGHIPLFHQPLISRPVPNDPAYCSDTCLTYLARRQYFTGFLQQSNVNNNPYYIPSDNANQRTINYGQQNYENEATNQDFLQKILEVRNQQKLITTQNHDVQIKNRANEFKEVQAMQQSTNNPDRNNYPLNPQGEVTIVNENADKLFQFSNENTAQFNERNVESNKQVQNANNQARHFNALNNERTYFYKQVRQQIENPDNHIELKETLQQQSTIPNPHNDIIHDQNIINGSIGRGADNQSVLIETEVHIIQTPNGIQHEITSTLNPPEVRKVDAEKALECANLKCSLGNWTGPVCACNNLTGKVASFRNECDLVKHNCRFDTDFKTIQEDVCPWEYPSRRSFSSDHVLFDYNKDIYYNDDII